MASLMEELMETLDAEEKLYQELIPVEQEKTRAIAGTDLEAMRRIVEKHRHTVGVGDEERASWHVGDHAVGIAEGVAGTVESAAAILFTSHEHLVGVDEVQAHHLPRTDAKICHKTVAVGAHRHDVVLCVQAQIQGLIRKITAAAVAR